MTLSGSPSIGALVQRRLATLRHYNEIAEVEIARRFLAVAVGLVELFFLGVFLGAISRERLWLSGLRLVVAGFIALAISLLLGGGVG